MAKQHKNILLEEPLSFETIIAYIKGELSDDEADYVASLIESDEMYKKTVDGFVHIGSSQLLDSALADINSQIDARVNALVVDKSVVAEPKTPWIRYLSVAASVLVLLGVGYWFVNSNTGENELAIQSDKTQNNEVFEESSNEPELSQGSGSDLNWSNTKDESNISEQSNLPALSGNNSNQELKPERADVLMQTKDDNSNQRIILESKSEKLSNPSTKINSEAEKVVNINASGGMESDGVDARKKAAAPAAVSNYGSIYGEVKDEEGNPLLGVKVVTNGNGSTTTDANGNFKLDVRKGVYNVKFDYLGYDEKLTTVNVGSLSDQNKVSIQLKKKEGFDEVADADDWAKEYVTTQTIKAAGSDEEEAEVSDPETLSNEISGLSSDQILQKGMQAFSIGNYNQAAEYYEIVLIKSPSRLEALYYAGMSYYNSRQYSRAIKKYDVLIANPVNNYYNQAMWYKAQALIKKNKKEEAKPILEKLSTSTNDYTARARALLQSQF